MGLRLFFLPNFPGATFIPDSRVFSWYIFSIWHFLKKKCLYCVSQKNVAEKKQKSEANLFFSGKFQANVLVR